MQLDKIEISKNSIHWYQSQKLPDGGALGNDKNCKEAPLKDFTESMDALKGVLLKLHPGTTELYWDAAIILGLTIQRTKNGTRSVFINYSRALPRVSKPSMPQKMLFRIDENVSGDEGDTIQMPLEPNDNMIVATAIMRAEDYANGKTSQMKLPLQTDEEDPDLDPAEGEQVEADLS